MCNSPLAKFVASHTQLGKKNVGSNSINHLLNCKGKGLLLAPDWKSASFYPYLKILLKKNTKCKMIRFKPDDVFIQGSDPTSFFGPNFNCAVNVYYLDFTK